MAFAVDFDEGAQHTGINRRAGAWRDSDLFGEVGFDPAGVHSEGIGSGEVSVIHDCPMER